MLRYGLYSRKSDKEDSDTIKSINDQNAYWRERAQQLGLEIAKVYEENQSAMVPGKRPVYRELIRDLEAGRINAVLVWHINRLARNVREGGEFAQLLIDGVIQEVRSPNAVYTPADNILPLLLEHGTAAQFSRDLSRTMKLTQTQMVKAGGWPHYAQIGYLNARDPLNARRGVIVPDPERFPIIRRGMDMMLTGTHSMAEVVDAMNGWGLRTRQTDRKPSKPLAYSRGYALFADPFYAGYVRYKGVLYPGNHPPMVSAAEFARIQQLRARSLRMTAARRSFPYSGLIRCGLCGLQVVGELKRKGGREYVYYHCGDSYNRCTRRGIAERALEEAIANSLAELVIDPPLEAYLLGRVTGWLSSGLEAVGRTLDRQRARLADIDRERESLLGLVVEGTLADRDLYRRKDAALVAERNRLLEAAKEAGESRGRIERNARATVRFAVRAAAEFASANPERKREIASALGSSYLLRESELEVTVDPRLSGMVRFAHQKTRSLEPGPRRSGSGGSALIVASIPYGGGDGSGFETDEELISLLSERISADIYPD